LPYCLDIPKLQPSKSFTGIITFRFLINTGSWEYCRVYWWLKIRGISGIQFYKLCPSRLANSGVRILSSFGRESVKCCYGQHLNLDNERSFRFGSAGIHEASQTSTVEKKDISLSFHLFPIFCKLKKNKKNNSYSCCHPTFISICYKIDSISPVTCIFI
jgi:hypothetical protein